MPDLHVLRVFVDERGEHGNPLGVFLDGADVGPAERQRIAAELDFSETVFVEDRASGRIRIHTPEVELPFAGHPCVGTAWLLKREGAPVTALRPPAGEAPVRFEGEVVWIEARPAWSTPFDFPRLATPAEIESLVPPTSGGNVYAWSWIDEAAGAVRARCFGPEVGIVEDEATGSAAIGLAARLDRQILIEQGRGSVLRARPLPERRAEVGGRVVLDESRKWSSRA